MNTSDLTPYAGPIAFPIYDHAGTYVAAVDAWKEDNGKAWRCEVTVWGNRGSFLTNSGARRATRDSAMRAAVVMSLTGGAVKMAPVDPMAILAQHSLTIGFGVADGDDLPNVESMDDISDAGPIFRG